MELNASVTIDEGVNAYGIRRQIILEGDQAVSKLTYDAEPLLDEAHIRRTVTAGDRWGDGHTHVGFIPMAELTRINDTYQSAEERKFQILCWLRDHPKLVTFDKFLK
ncbi:MAG: hypothetical protein HQ446_00605 [Polaromonas sp.]|nr:hypothetical protein [Polaromonas sp.]